MTNYTISKINYEQLSNDKFKIDEKIYKVNHSEEPNYWNDSVLNISYHKLYDQNGEESIYVLAFNRIEGVTSEEWSEEYDIENQYILAIYR